MIFKTNDGSDGTSPTERIRIDSLGHVGVNTSSPDANGFGSGNGILTVASDTGSAKTAMLNLVGDGNDTDATRVASLFYNDASATGAGATLAGIEAYRASNHATDPGANLVFSTNVGATGGYAERMRIRAAGGLTFNGDTAAANALDDYEEGTWTPVFAGSSGVSGQTYSQQLGAYTKVGRFVYLTAYVVLSNVGSVTGSYAYINGLPFAPSSDSNAYFGVGQASYVTNVGVNASSIMLYANPAATFSYVTYFAGATTGITYMPPAGFTNSTGMIFNLGYATNA